MGRKRVDGALAPLADSYREELRRLGYGPRSGLRQMDLLADLSPGSPARESVPTR